jgi:hypothetical protein
MSKIWRRLRQALREPLPLRFLFLRWLDQRFDLFAYSTAIELGSVEMAHYGHCLLHTAQVARKLGYTRISAIEFGVAGANGLVALERHGERVRNATGVDIAVDGFDTGAGMPPPRDVRDIVRTVNLDRRSKNFARSEH